MRGEESWEETGEEGADGGEAGADHGDGYFEDGPGGGDYVIPWFDEVSLRDMLHAREGRRVWE